MPKIKSFEELEKIRNNLQDKLELRKTGENENSTIIAVGMATCGIAAGARETMNAIIDELSKQEIKNIAVVQTGCIGYCHLEPIVEVRQPDRETIRYGNVDTKLGREIVSQHIKNGRLIDNAIIGRGIDRI